MDPALLQPGQRLDRYELLCPLAYGGMASVWLARFGGRKVFERLVVIKMILPQYAQDPRFQEMFLDEARIASRVEHPNVARIIDVGEEQDNIFIVMEWVDGDSLSKVMRAAERSGQPVPAGVALRICADAAAGLHAAHSLRERDGTHLAVVHRDVSPQNILVSNAGSTLLIDFGVAKARDRVSQDTSAGQLKGKVRYMAPEQAMGHPVDHRADIWGLGAILYELVAGVPPYDGPNDVATIHLLTSGARPPPLPPHVPEPIRIAVGCALGYDRDARFPTALDLSLALESCIVQIGQPTTTAAVARYTAELLDERKAARARAVDAALAAAHARDAERTARLAQPAPRPVVNAALTTQSTTARIEAFLPAPPQSGRELPSSPSAASTVSAPTPGVRPSDVAGLKEVPSVTSSATLGSAAMEYPPEPVAVAPRGSRYVMAALLGVAAAAAIVGTLLIVNATLSRPKAPSALASSASPSPPETTAPPPPATATATAAAAPTEPVTPDAATTSTEPVTPDAATTSTAAPEPTTPPPPRTTAPHAAAPIHRHATVAAPPKPAPKPAPTPTSKSPDRGF